MGQPTMMKSQTGFNAMYVQIQARIRHDDGMLHIQACGPAANRPYGISADIELSEIDKGIVTWLDTVNRIYDSMAGTDKKYFVCQMRHVSSTNKLNIQVTFSPVYNTPYGCVFTIKTDGHTDLLMFLSRCMETEGKPMYTSQPEMITEVEI